MRTSLLLFAAACTVAAGLFSCSESASSPRAEVTPITQDSLVKRGNYLVSSIGCDDCHSPKTFGPQGPQVDMEHRFSGYPADRPIAKVNGADSKNGWVLFGGDLTSTVGPWGMSFSANISSDSTGIGNWTEAQFMTAIRKGKFKGIESNRDLLPPMPWQNFSLLSDDDLRAIFAYLKASKPVHNIVPAPKAPNQL